ncbi:MAG: NUDIX domain-containing protein [Clostridiales bacterium]|nr:NUDIX domain-containing protein [Clostridiales bacterium]
MRFKYCPHCGEKLIKKEIGDEGLIPYCERCKVPLWDMFTTSVICVVISGRGEVCLLRQGYVSAESYICVAGIMKIGESAEETAVREIKEEIGQEVKELSYLGTYPYGKNDMLMIGFKARVDKTELHLSGEVDSAKWFPFSEALENMREGSLAKRLVKRVIKEEKPFI